MAATTKKKTGRKSPSSAVAEGIALSRATRVADLAAIHGGVLDAAIDDAEIDRVAPIASAGARDLAPLTARRYLKAAKDSVAVLLVDAAFAASIPEGRRWIHPHASYVLASILATVAPPPSLDARALAHIDPEASVDATAIIGPGAVVLAGAVIGAGARVEPNAVIYGGVILGARSVVGAGAVIGRPGFGWAAAPSGGVIRIPQLGGVHIEEDVEIGALATVDAGTLGPTIIERGAKLDAMVHVGHNARIGKGTIVAAQSGFAGSTRIGAGVLVGGQAGVADHVVVGDGAQLAAKAGVIGDVAPGAVVAGYPAVDRARWLRATARALREKKR